MQNPMTTACVYITSKNMKYTFPYIYGAGVLVYTRESSPRNGIRSEKESSENEKETNQKSTKKKMYTF